MEVARRRRNNLTCQGRIPRQRARRSRPTSESAPHSLDGQQTVASAVMLSEVLQRNAEHETRLSTSLAIA
jgi:hypothetical protein